MASNNETNIQTISDIEKISDTETAVHERHVELVKDEQKAAVWYTQCTECSMHYNDQESLQRCLRTHSSDSEVRTAVFKCKNCETELTWSRHILKHMMVLSGEKSYLCGVCAKSVSLEDMDNHSHDGTLLICGVCEAQCHTEQELEIHCTSHHAKDTKGGISFYRAGKRAERKRSQKSPVSRSNSMENDLHNPLRIRMENELKDFYHRLRTQMLTKTSTITSAESEAHLQSQNKRLKTVGLFRCRDCGLQFKEEAVLKIHSLVHGVSLDQVNEATATLAKAQGVSSSGYPGQATGAVAQGGKNGESPLQDDQCTILCGICGQVFTSEEQVRTHCLMHTRELTNQSKAINQNSTKDDGKNVFDNQSLILASKDKEKKNTLQTEPAEAMDLSASGSGRKHLPSSIEQLKLLRSILENNGIISSSDKTQYENVESNQYESVSNETPEAMDLSASGSGRFEKSQFVETSKEQNNEIYQVEVITGCSPEHTITEVETLETQTKPKDTVTVTVTQEEGDNVVECYIVGEETPQEEYVGTVSSESQEGYVATVSSESQEGYVATVSAEVLDDQDKVDTDIQETQAATDAIITEENNVVSDVTQENGLQSESVSNSVRTPHYCNVCSETFATEESLYVHYRVHDIPTLAKKDPSPCELELVKDNLETHLAEHMGQSCEICFKPHEAMEHLIKHSVHNCCFCDSCFCKIESLEKHMYTLHKRRIRYTCEKCGGKYNWLYHLQEHMLMHSAGETTTP